MQINCLSIDQSITWLIISALMGFVDSKTNIDYHQTYPLIYSFHNSNQYFAGTCFTHDYHGHSCYATVNWLPYILKTGINVFCFYYSNILNKVCVNFVLIYCEMNQWSYTHHLWCIATCVQMSLFTTPSLWGLQSVFHLNSVVFNIPNMQLS